MAKVERHPLENEISRILKLLDHISANRPKSRKTLASYVVTSLRNGNTTDDAESIIGSLVSQGKITIDPKGRVSYWLQ